MKIAHHAVVALHYQVADDQGVVLDTSNGKEPLRFLQGHAQIIPGLEKALEGREAGETFEAVVPMDEAYGPRHPELIQDVPRAAFQGVETLEPGMQFQGRNDQGTVNVTISKVEGDEVTVDANHPLAGKDLHFRVEIVNVREATDEERHTGHAQAD